ncbi:hypothetical protein Rsub_03584 [Raphidocelis subcapitata]|uniref:Uncharacterized protein n=1 Tax=Raphidocelis subcapitata TaxID=307507 RepID=A0A2V0NUE7_9CHLO|nr:hypothetical protein Rsub_03584 [Raphidocelis subcapitata]|eukprot:GBF91264.1 hypothetical protein Rsub_03584 [Raphidocelis subcapitata]
MDKRLLLLALLGTLVVTPSSAQAPAFQLVGNSAHMRLQQGNQTVDLRVGRVYETNAAGTPVPGHALPSLASLSPVMTNGTRTVNGTTVNYATLTVGNLTSLPNFAGTTCPGGGAPISTATALAQATVNVTVFWGFAADVAFPYGPDGGYVNATANSMKFSIDVAGWPFCSATAGQLMVELTMHTSAGDDDGALLFDDAEPEDSNANSTTSSGTATAGAPIPAPASRRLLVSRSADAANGKAAAAAATAPQVGNGGAGHSQAGGRQDAGADDQEGSAHDDDANGATAPHEPQDGAESPHAAGRPERPERPDPSRPPRRPEGRDGGGAPQGRRPRLFAALLSADAAAALDIQTVAYDVATSPPTALNVSVYAPAAKQVEAVDGGASRNVSRITLGFPTFTGSLHYDPVLAVEAPAELGYTSATANATTNATTTAARGAAGAARAPAALALCTALGAAALLLAL